MYANWVNINWKGIYFVGLDSKEPQFCSDVVDWRRLQNSKKIRNLKFASIILRLTRQVYYRGMFTHYILQGELFWKNKKWSIQKYKHSEILN